MLNEDQRTYLVGSNVRMPEACVTVTGREAAISVYREKIQNMNLQQGSKPKGKIRIFDTTSSDIRPDLEAEAMDFEPDYSQVHEKAQWNQADGYKIRRGWKADVPLDSEFLLGIAEEDARREFKEILRDLPMSERHGKSILFDDPNNPQSIEYQEARILFLVRTFQAGELDRKFANIAKRASDRAFDSDSSSGELEEELEDLRSFLRNELGFDETDLLETLGIEDIDLDGNPRKEIKDPIIIPKWIADEAKKLRLTGIYLPKY